MKYTILLLLAAIVVLSSFTEKPEVNKERAKFEFSELTKQVSFNLESIEARKFNESYSKAMFPPDEPTIAENAVIGTYGSYPQSGYCGEWQQTTPGSGIWKKTCSFCSYAGCVECVDTVIIVSGVATKVERACLAP